MSAFFAATANRAMAVAIVGLLLLATMLAHAVRSANRDLADERAENSAIEAQLAVIRTNEAAQDAAGVERAADTAAAAARQEALTDAIQSVPDTAPDAVRVALGCERLRRARGLDADLPPACRPGG